MGSAPICRDSKEPLGIIPAGFAVPPVPTGVLPGVTEPSGFIVVAPAVGIVCVGVTTGEACTAGVDLLDPPLIAFYTVSINYLTTSNNTLIRS